MFSQTQKFPNIYENKNLNEEKYTDLHLASQNEEEEVNSLWNHFDKNEKEKLFEYLMKEDVMKKDNKEKNKTILHHASQRGHEEIVKLLLNEYGKEKKKNCLNI